MSTRTPRISRYSDHTTFDHNWLLCFAHGRISSAPFWVYNGGIIARDHPPAVDSDPGLIAANTSELSGLHNSSLPCPLPLGKDAVVPRDLRTRLLQMHHPSVAHNTGRGIGHR